tara:strand:- start:39 stop:437 length:399 start_codon:yes stop_codon:yes gene_type:complete
MNTIVSQKSERTEHTLCDDILRLIGKHVELIRIRHKHEQNMFPILQSIQQIGGWAEWHYTPEYLQNRYSCGYTDEFPDRQISWLISPCGGCLGNKNDHIGVLWDEVINYKNSFWLDDLLMAECSYQFGYRVL